MSNFDFLKTEWLELYTSAQKVELLVNTDTRTCCFHARRTLELAVHWLYQNDKDLKAPYENHLSALIYEPTFKDNLPRNIFSRFARSRKPAIMQFISAGKSLRPRPCALPKSSFISFSGWPIVTRVARLRNTRVLTLTRQKYLPGKSRLRLTP